MGKKSAVPARQYTMEFKIEAVKLAEAIGGNQAPSAWMYRTQAYGTGFA